MDRVSKGKFEDEGEFGGRSDEKEEELLRERECDGRNPFHCISRLIEFPAIIISQIMIQIYPMI